MIRFLIQASLLALIGVVAAAAVPAPAPTIRAAGIMVAATVNDPDLSDISPWDVGIRVRLELGVADGMIVECVGERSKVTSFKDDKGTNLLSKGDPVRPNGFVKSDVPGFNLFPKYAKDRKLCVTEFLAPKPPAKGATSISLQGEVLLLVASESQEVTLDNVATAVGAKITIGDIPLEIVSVEKARFGNGTTITFQTDRDLTALAEVSFFGPDGTTLRQTGSGTLTKSGKVNREYTLASIPATVKIVIKVWKGMKSVKVPIDLKVGLGL